MNKSVAFDALISRIAEGDVANLRNILLNKHCSANECDEFGQTLLMIAAQQGQIAIVNELLAHGADVNAEDADNWSALTNAAKFGFKEIVVKLLDHGADIEHRDMGQWTALMWACYKGHYYVVKILLEHGAVVNVLDKNHCTPLIWAAGRGFLEIVEALLERGAKVYSSDKHGTSPLVWACRKGYTEIVPLILEAGANVDTAGMFSWTPLLVATKGNYASIVNMLLERKPNVNAVDMDGCTALSIACKEGYTEIAKALMNAGAYINLPDRNGDTNLIHAAKTGHFSIVDALIRKYADIDLAGADGKTALYWAVEKSCVDIVRLILSANPNCEIATKDGDTPLLKATRNRNAEIVQLLVDKKCRVSAADKKGDTALHIAMRARSKAIVEILLRNPKNSQLLYRPNRAGETPYNIDTNHQKSILAQIFGARRLNTNEDSENRLGYDLYSSALADILSEPSLSMPIAVGLYAKWGSGKSFLLNKLENEMKSFAIQWLEPMFEFSRLVFLLTFFVSVIIGLIMFLATKVWIFGVYISVGVFVSILVFLGAVIHINKNYDFSWMYKISLYLAKQLSSLRTLLFVLFCSPPANKRNDLTDPVRFLFTEQTKVTSSGTDNSILQVVISLYVAIEKEYGLFTCRLHRILKPKPVASKWWQYRSICCIPNFVIALLVMVFLGCIAVLVLETDAAYLQSQSDDYTTVYRSVFITMLAVVIFVVLANLCTLLRILKSLLLSHQRRLAGPFLRFGSSKDESCISSLKNEVDTIVQMVQCLDAFVGQQTRLVVIVDGLDSCEQDKVLYILDAMHTLFSDANAPFVTVLAIDPHIVIKAIESNIHKAFQKSNISGYEYLRNVVHLPFYLQNSGLRRVKAAQQAALLWNKKSGNYWNEDRECDRAVPTVSGNRKASNSSMSIPDAFRKRGKGTQKLKASESLASSISNLHRVVTGAQDLTKVLLTDDYFSDVNPRSMRRLMNIVYITGRLLKAFNIDFNWYHLASWVNITEQWPYRTSWIIMYYEMHENEFDDVLPLKTIYEKIKCYIPSSKDQEPTLDLDHDEKKFEVFLSFHSSSLQVNDLKVFLPFTINLDPFIRKVLQETHQQISEFLKSDLKPSSSPPTKCDALSIRIQQHIATPLHHQDYSHTMGYMPLHHSHHTRKDIFQSNTASPVHNFPTAPSPWWNYPMEHVASHQAMYHSSKSSSLMLLPDQEKLSTLSVAGVSDLLRSQEKLNKKKLDSYINTIEDNNIGGQVLLTCDLKELKETLNMSFGDWELFRVLILTLREHEMENVNCSFSNEEKSAPVLPLKQTGSFKNKTNSSGSPEMKSGDSVAVGKSSRSAAEPTDGVNSSQRSRASILEKQPIAWQRVLNEVTMEESMIVGALETLNEDALEDAMEEKGLMSRKASNSAVSSANPLSPILSDPEELGSDDRLEGESMPNVAHTPSDVDVLFLRSLQNSPLLRVSAISLSDSMTDAETSSLGRMSQNFGPPLETSTLSGTKSDEYDSASVTSSPSRNFEMDKNKTRSSIARPSSLVCDSANNSAMVRSEGSFKGKSNVAEKSAKRHVEKGNSFSLGSCKSKLMKRKSASKSDSSDSSTETDEKVKPKISSQKTAPTPGSDADGFFSDDEHTPLVSPFHINRSSHYNLQYISKSEKESTPEKCIPKQSKSDLGPHRKIRKPLERQFSIDSNLCDRSRPPPTSTSMVEIATPSSMQYVPILPAYGQDVTDSPSDSIPISSLLESQLHNETVL
ncbi:kinase D-interacting substrate of 220 kDa B-like [Uloborus diversus]|uniref:kinase D-interacting substrate of 220 kDa B-like n=1 Tax=Uloborus diversus TaxID=327109 RepID=UPI00240A1E04|nr:kinase D-interacting substrate of 220 kDa B-like [Uloborus diversus]